MNDELMKFNQIAEELNSFLVSSLVELNVTDAAETIKAAFYAQRVDPMVRGDWYEIREELDIDPSIEIPGPDPDPVGDDSLAPFLFGSGQRKKSTVNHKSKQKRKSEKKSRKQNRKKK
jgi:hypothetical protein